MRLIMAVSHDGFVAKSTADDMQWTGPTDKQVFRLLTCVGGVLGVGRTTYDLMPRKLKGRKLVALSTRPELGLSLGAFAHANPDAWLGGGQTLAMAALGGLFVDEVHLVRNTVELGEGIADEVTPFLQANPLWWSLASSMQLNWGSLTIEVWRLGL